LTRANTRRGQPKNPGFARLSDGGKRRRTPGSRYDTDRLRSYRQEVQPWLRRLDVHHRCRTRLLTVPRGITARSRVENSDFTRLTLCGQRQQATVGTSSFRALFDRAALFDVNAIRPVRLNADER